MPLEVYTEWDAINAERRADRDERDANSITCSTADNLPTRLAGVRAIFVKDSNSWVTINEAIQEIVKGRK